MPRMCRRLIRAGKGLLTTASTDESRGRDESVAPGWSQAFSSPVVTDRSWRFAGVTALARGVSSE